MVEERLEDSSQDEFRQIMDSIRNGKNFLLSGGAGSGKTYTLVKVIEQIILEFPTSKVACMTYTNSAVKEIEDRVNHQNLNVTTIHDFLWDNINHFQDEIKSSLIALANNPEETRIKIESITPVPDNFFDHLLKGIQYKEYLRIEEGIISHDELLILANHIFKSSPKLCGIIKDKYKFILIDEYQDTNEKVIEIFLDHFKLSHKKNIIGFFGDAMQSIYDDSIGNLDKYLNAGNFVTEIKKQQNRRSPKLIIDLANELRTDGIIQIPSTDLNAPNMSESGIVKEGNLKFVYSERENLETIRSYLGWDFENSKVTKELNLTHNLIASKAGFKSLMEIYNNDSIIDFKNKIRKYIKDNNISDDFSELTFGEVIIFLQRSKTGRELNRVSPTPNMLEFFTQNIELYEFAKSLKWEIFSKYYVDKDQLLDDKKQDSEDENKKGSNRDNLIKHLFKIQNSIYLYASKQFNEFLHRTEKKIYTIQDKIDLKQSIEDLINVGDKTVEQVVDLAHEKGVCIKDEKLNNFINDKEYIYNRVKLIPFKEFQKLYDFLEGFTPFSTKHKTKGAEFDNVLVILDNGRWNKYNFENLFIGGGSESVLDRTQKIFYVCCTRSKENLAVFYHKPSQAVISKAKQWFGELNVIDIDDLILE